MKFKMKGDVSMKSRAECLKEYGSDYLIQQKVKSGETVSCWKGRFTRMKRACRKWQCWHINTRRLSLTMHRRLFIFMV